MSAVLSILERSLNAAESQLSSDRFDLARQEEKIARMRESIVLGETTIAEIQHAIAHLSVAE